MSTSQNPLFLHRKKPDQSYGWLLSDKLQVLEAVVRCISLTNEQGINDLGTTLLPLTLANVFEEFREIYNHYFYENFEFSIPVEKKLIELSEKLHTTPNMLIEKMLKSIEITS